MSTIWENELDKIKVHKWKIKILNSKGKYIDVGVAPIDFDINSATENNSGWYSAFDNSKLYSGLRKLLWIWKKELWNLLLIMKIKENLILIFL